MKYSKYLSWWHGLTASQRDHVHRLDEGARLPDALVPGLVRYRGSVVDRDWWDDPDRSTRAAGFPLPTDVRRLVHAEDPTRPVTEIPRPALAS